MNDPHEITHISEVIPGVMADIVERWATLDDTLIGFMSGDDTVAYPIRDMDIELFRAKLIAAAAESAAATGAISAAEYYRLRDERDALRAELEKRDEQA